MIDDMAVAVARPLLLVVRFAWWLVWEWLVWEVLWWIGWPVCRVLSFGRLPQDGWREADRELDLDSTVVLLVGLLVLLGALWGLQHWAG